MIKIKQGNILENNENIIIHQDTDWRTKMTEMQKIAESQHKVLVGITIFLVIIVILVILSIMSVTKTMNEKDKIIGELENKMCRLERGE